MNVFSELYLVFFEKRSEKLLKLVESGDIVLV